MASRILALFAFSIILLFQALPVVAQPSNDDFDSATVISTLPFSDSELDTTGATVASDDPSLFCTNGLSNTVWYSFTAPQNMPLGFEAFGTDYINAIAIFTGSRGALTFLGCSGLGQNYQPLQAVAGTTYHIMVTADTFGSPGGLLDFQAHRGPTVQSLVVNQVASVNNATGVATISGTIACDHSANATVAGTLRQRATRFIAITGQFSFSTACSPGGTPWSTTVVADKPFGGGPAGVDATGVACLKDSVGFDIDIICTSQGASQTLHLRGGHK
jgi:hypothetical protein